MSLMYSEKRVKCKDYFKRHRKVIYKTSEKSFTQLGNLSPSLTRYIGSELPLNETDEVCRNCYTVYKRALSYEQMEDEIQEVSASCSEEVSYVPPKEVIEALNIGISAVQADMSPFKQPEAVRSERRSKYCKRKKLELEASLVEAASSKLDEAYQVPTVHSECSDKTECSSCMEWIENMQHAVASSSPGEKVQLLTLLPNSLSKRQILSDFKVSKYLVDKSRKVKNEKGVWEKPDPYTGHHVDAETIKLTLSYFTDDSRDCSRQSPNKSDVITVVENGEKVKRVKRFMTRSVKEAYCQMKVDYPEKKIGHTKFYSLRPKWVMLQPVKEVCTCVYCTNMKLICSSLKRITGNQVEEKILFTVCLCEDPSDKCWLQECGECPGSSGITLEYLGLEEAEEVTFAHWEFGDLIKKTVSPEGFLLHLQKWVMKGITHSYIREIQRTGITAVKNSVNEDIHSLILHFDFAENWAVVLPDAVQSYHWQNTQVSIFTCVAYFCRSRQSFAIACDDLTHDSAHALCALQLIIDAMNKKFHGSSPFKSMVYISDGAASHFKNRFQLHELFHSLNHMDSKKWIFSATGHGKSACDGIGGLSKHFATIFNLQKEPIEAIRNAQGFASKVGNLLKNVTVMFLEKEYVEGFRSMKKKEWKYIKQVVGIRSTHLWSVDKSGIYTSRTVKHSLREVQHYVENQDTGISNYSIHDFNIGDFISCVYDEYWWMARVTEVSCELSDITVDFMEPHGPANGFKWPTDVKILTCSVKLTDVILKLKPPTPIGTLGRLHKFEDEEISKIEERFSLF